MRLVTSRHDQGPAGEYVCLHIFLETVDPRVLFRASLRQKRLQNRQAFADGMAAYALDP